MKINIRTLLKTSITWVKTHSIHLLLSVLILIALSLTPLGHRFKAEKIGEVPVWCRTNKVVPKAYLEYQDYLAKLEDKVPTMLDTIYLNAIAEHEYADIFNAIRIREYRLFFIKVGDKRIFDPAINTADCRCETRLDNGACQWGLIEEPIKVNYSSLINK